MNFQNVLWVKSETLWVLCQKYNFADAAVVWENCSDILKTNTCDWISTLEAWDTLSFQYAFFLNIFPSNQSKSVLNIPTEHDTLILRDYANTAPGLLHYLVNPFGFRKVQLGKKKKRNNSLAHN